ncbi:MAG: TCP-1/cpn60 chaperonin family protein [Desulfurococcaceae archaeon]|jgi:thermosome|nr:TCP-1/cpn60 chaperonin family protein [Desulfurococcaceae archaeon]
MAQRGVAPAPTAGIPVLILKEGTQRTTGAEALRSNMVAAMTIAEILRTTYGPRGMDKMLVDTLGDVTITNDGATILDKMDVQHPTAKMLVQIAKGQDDEVGDGTKTAVIFAGELLKAAEDLLNKEVHPTIIINGYKKALEEAVKYAESVAKSVDVNDFETLKKIASTALTSKAVHGVREYFAEIAVKAVKQVAEDRDGRIYVDLDNIQIIKKHGGSLADTKLVYGVILDKEVVHPGMPKRVEKARIALIDAPLEIEKTEIDAEIRISDPEMMRKFIEQKENILKDMVEKIAATGANVVICQKGIDDVAQHFLAKKGILAVRRVKRSDMEKLERATGGKIVSNIDDLTPNDLGYAELVEERKVGEDKMVFVEGTKDPKAVSIIIRGGLERVVDEAERSFRDALSVVADVLRVPKIVYGGGSFEIEIARYLREYSTKVGGKEQLAVLSFAKALEGVVSALVENAGLDPIDMISELRSAHNKPDGVKYGVNVFSGKVDDMEALGVIEPLTVKTNALKAGTEAATLVLRIDDVVAASKVKEEKKEEKKEKKEEEEK